MHRLAQRGTRVVVVTVFTADPPADLALSPLARNHHRAWEIGDAPFALRAAEDERAAELLRFEAVHLGLFDALYRADPAGRAFYQHDIVRVPVDPVDAAVTLPAICEAVRSRLAGVDAPRLVAPLAIGGHVDHVLVRQAAESLAAVPVTAYYEEFPYAWRGGAAALPAEPGLHAAVAAIDIGDVEKRIDAIACYPSQIAGLFPSRGDIVRRGLADRLPPLARLFRPPSSDAASSRMATAVRDWAARVGGERYWLR